LHCEEASYLDEIHRNASFPAALFCIFIDCGKGWVTIVGQGQDACGIPSLGLPGAY
jgi:hypothetical protein